MGLSNDAKSRAKNQIEFYFSDSNVPRDKFLRSKIEDDPEGFVDIGLICSFSRMTEALGIKRGDKGAKVIVPQDVVSQVAEALRGSDSLTVSEDGKRVRRSKPIDSIEDTAKAVDARSLYAGPFPYNATLDGITAFFNRAAPVNCVRMRRHLKSKDFRGSVFVEFASEEHAQQVLKQTLEYEGAQLRLEPKMDFVQRKMSERKDKAENGEADDEDAEDAEEAAEKAAEPAAAQKAVEAAEKADTSAAAPAEAPVAGAEEAGPAPEQEFQHESGLLVQINFGDAEHELSYFDIKQKLEGVAFVEYQKGASTGIVRFKTKDDADTALSQAGDDGKVTISDVAAELTRVEGDNEVTFYKRAAAAAALKKEFERSGGERGRGRKRGFSGGGGRGGRWHKRGRR